MSFTVKGTAVIPDLLATPREEVEVTWYPVRERPPNGDPIVGDILVAERVAWLAEEDVELPATPTGPFIPANLDDSSWAFLAVLTQFAEAPEVSGKLPKVAYTMVPHDAVA